MAAAAAVWGMGWGTVHSAVAGSLLLLLLLLPVPLLVGLTPAWYKGETKAANSTPVNPVLTAQHWC